MRMMGRRGGWGSDRKQMRGWGRVNGGVEEGVIGKQKRRMRKSGWSSGRGSDQEAEEGDEEERMVGLKGECSGSR